VHLLNDGTAHHRHQQQQQQQQQQQLSDVSADDWEIDPRHVALGVEIGQGAFGRVLTGFFRDQQVAIKVLKGTVRCHFLSYRLLTQNGLAHCYHIITTLLTCNVT